MIIRVTPVTVGGVMLLSCVSILNVVQAQLQLTCSDTLLLKFPLVDSVTMQVIHIGLNIVNSLPKCGTLTTSNYIMQ